MLGCRRPAGFDPVTRCLEGTSPGSPEVARCRPIRYLSAAIVAGCRPAWPKSLSLLAPRLAPLIQLSSPMFERANGIGHARPMQLASASPGDSPLVSYFDLKNLGG